MARPKDKPTLALFKRQIKPGVTVKITNHPAPHLNRTVKVERAQTNAFIVESSDLDNPREAWVYWERAANCKISTDGKTCTMFKGEKDEPWITVEVLVIPIEISV